MMNIHKGNILHCKAEGVKATAMVDVVFVHVVQKSRKQVDHQQHQHNNGGRQPEQRVENLVAFAPFNIKEQVEQNAPRKADVNR